MYLGMLMHDPIQDSYSDAILLGHGNKIILWKIEFVMHITVTSKSWNLIRTIVWMRDYKLLD